MDKKVTRRAVLGTTIAALATGPFIIQALRQPRSLPDSWATAEREAMRVKIAENSGLPLADVTTVLAIFQAERERWLRLRGLKANVSIVLEGQSPATNGEIRSLSEEGVISILISEERVSEELLPWNVHLQFDPDGGEESGEYMIFSDLSKKPVLKGRRTEVADPSHLLDVIVAPFSFFACHSLEPVEVI